MIIENNNSLFHQKNAEIVTFGINLSFGARTTRNELLKTPNELLTTRNELRGARNEPKDTQEKILLKSTKNETQ